MFKLKKIASALASVAMVGATLGLAAATTYPQPFVNTSGVADAAIVYGSDLDVAAATRIQSSLAGFTTATGGSTTITGEAVDLASGSDYIYLNDELNENIASLTKDELPTILADGTFTDDSGDDTDYEQTITIDSGASFAFSNSGNDLDDPALLISLPSSTISSSSTKIYTSTVTFDEAVNFTASDSEGQTITLFGKTYTVGTATDSTKLILLGGSDSETINIGETKPLEAGSETYSVTLNGISDATTPQASLTINGETKTFSEGQTKSFSDGDLDVFVKTVFRTGENNGFVEIQLGADKLTLENNKKVKMGSDETNVDGTLVTLTGTPTALTSLTIGVAAPDNDMDDLLVGDSFMDPVFGSFSVLFDSVSNGPVFSGHDDTSADRTMLAIEKGGNRELQITATTASGDEDTIPFTYQNGTTDDNSKSIHLVEGESLAEDEYTGLVSGSKQFFVQVSSLDLTAGGATDDEIELTDMFSGNSYTKTGNFSASGGQSLNIGGQTFTITQADSTHVTVTSSDYSKSSGSGYVEVYPYVELVNGQDHRFAITDNVSIAAVEPGTVFNLPTGTITLSTNTSATASTGTVYYNYTITPTGGDATTATVTIALDAQQDNAANAYNAPALLFVEDEDKSDSTPTDKNAVVLKTTDTGTYSTVLAPVFTSTGYDSETFDDSDFTGYLTNFGTYVLFDSSDSNQDFASLTYPKNQMYANVFFAEADAISEGPSTLVPVMDTESSKYAGKNLVVVGGSCVNTVAASLLGSSTEMCGADWEAATGVSAGQYLIQSFDRSGKVATLVAGYNQDDTNTAATALTTQTVDTTVGTKYTGSTEDNLVPVITSA